MDMDWLPKVIHHFGQSEHFKNLVFLMMMSVLSVMILKQMPIPQEYWGMTSFVAGYYFGSNKTKEVS